MATEWDVFAMLPGATAPAYLATLYEASEKSIRVELDGTGQGSFAVNRTSPECTEAILAQGNLVKVRIPEIHTGYIFGFFLETGDFTLISSDEGGGEMLRFGGRGALAYTEYARAWSASYIAGGQGPIDNVWRAYAAGTGNKPGQILRRLLEEFQDPDRPQQPLPHLTIDFDYDVDSNAETWIATDATAEFSYQAGEDGLAIITRLLPTGITVQMGPDFDLHAYNEYGRDLTGDALGAGVVRFVRGVNIATELRRQRVQTDAATHMLVAGETDHYARAVLPAAASLVTKEAYVAAFGVGATALVGIGLAELRERERTDETIMFPIANRRTVVSLADPVTVGAVQAIPGLAAAGYYLPGPPGTNGDFWVGDTVRVHTGTGQFDFDEVDVRVTAITITRRDDNGELDIIPELRPQPIPADVTATLLSLQAGATYWNEDASTPEPTNGDGSLVVGWRYTGDAPESGWTEEPLDGPIEYYPFDPPLTRGTIPIYRGLQVNEYSIVDIAHVGGFGGVALPGATITVHIRQNGEIISEQTQLWPFEPEVGIAFWPGVFTFALPNSEAQPGDQFEVSVVPVGWAESNTSWYYAVQPGELNPNSHFRVVTS